MQADILLIMPSLVWKHTHRSPNSSAALQQPDPQFSESKTYVYKYEALLLAGLPEKGLARAGLKITSKVQISGVAQKTYLLKVVDPQVYEYNGIWPKDQFAPTEKVTRLLASQLQNPIKFEYSNGRVGNIYAPEDVSETAGIGGVCQTNYLIQEQQRGNRIIVTKSKDLNNCEDRVRKDIGMAYAEHCAYCQQRGKNLRGVAAYNYVMKPTDSGALIIEATAQEVHQYTPFNEVLGSAQVEARQNLAFVELRSSPVRPADSEYQDRGSLKYEFSSEVLQTPIQLTRNKNPETQITETLTHLVQHNQQHAHPDAPARFLLLTQLLRSANHQNIEAIWKQFENRKDFRRWVLDAIPAVGTAYALRFIKEKIQENAITEMEAAQALITALHLTKADHETMPFAQALANSRHIQQSPVLRKITMLGYGSMVFKFCSLHQSCSDNVLQPLHDFAADAASKAHQEDIVLALKALGNAGQPASLKRIQKFLPGFSSGASHMPVKVQVDAVMALRNIAKKEPKKVQEITLQLFMEKQLHPEVRIMSCIVLFETRPTIAVVTTLTEALLKETSLQVASFTYSHMKALTRSRLPDYRPVAAASNVAVKLLSPKLDRLSYRYSKAIRLDTFNSEIMAGAAAKIFVINNAASILPTAVVSKIRAYVAGSAADFLEVGVRTEGLQDIIMKRQQQDINPARINKIQNILKALSGWKSLPSNKPIASAYIKLFGQEVSFAELDKNAIEDAVQMATGPLQRHDTVRKLVKQLQDGAAAQWSKPLLAAEVRRIIPTCVGFPAEVSLYSAAVAASAANVQTRMSPAPADNFRVSQLLNTNIQVQAELTPSISLHTVAVMGINTHLIQSAVEIYAKGRAAIPLKFVARVDLKEMNFKLESAPCQQEEEILNLRAEAFAVTRNVEDLSATRKTLIVPDSAESNILKQQFTSQQQSSREHSQGMPKMSSELQSAEIPYYAEGAPHKHMASYYRQSCAKATNFGFQLCYEGKTQNAAFIRNSCLYKAVGQHAARIVLKPAHSEGTIEKLQVEIQAGAKAASKIIKMVSLKGLTEEETEENPEGKNVLLKLKKILTREEHRFLGDNLPPVLAIVARAIRTDGEKRGYQVAVYSDLTASKPRAQVIVAELAEKSRWQICADAILLSKHKAMAVTQWGKECQDYKIAFKAVTGQLGAHPAVQLKTQFWKIPTAVKKTAKMMAEYAPSAAFYFGFSQQRQSNPSREMTVILAATSPRTIDAVIKIPKMTFYTRAVRIPLALPVGVNALDQQKQAGWSILADLPDMFADSYSAQCSASSSNLLTTFNNVRVNNEIPISCYQVLAQDCSDELKFMVMLKKDEISERNRINVKVADIDVDMDPRGDAMFLKVDGLEIPAVNLPYTDSTGSVTIEQTGDGLSLRAVSHGLSEIYFDGNSWKIQVAASMAGRTCGICGRGDGETREEYQMPNGEAVENAQSFMNSWVIPGDSCKNAQACRMQHESVKMEKEVNLEGQNSKCYSVEPVLRCLPGCSPTRTAPVTVGFHCLPADSYVSRPDNMAYFSDKSVDLKDTVDSHVACSCNRCA
ncbi:VIT protein, partial [Polypterus senegalus]